VEIKIIRDFIQYLQDRHSYSQSHIARKAQLSQGVVNKIMVGSHTRRPDVETFQHLTAAFALDWEEFLEKHPKLREELREYFRFALPAMVAPTTRVTGDPELSEAQQLLESIFRNANHDARGLLLQQLRSQSEYIAGTEQKAVAAGGSRRGPVSPKGAGPPQSRR